MLAAPLLTTERLVLRGHRADDFANCYALWGDREVVHHILDEPSLPAECWARLQRYAGHWMLLGYGFWAVEERASGRFVGDVGLGDFRRGLGPDFDGAPEAGWVLATWAHGKGYATEAAKAAIAWAEQALAMRRCVCMVSPRNHGSLRVAAKCGFTAFAKTEFNDNPVVLLERQS